MNSTRRRRMSLSILLLAASACMGDMGGQDSAELRALRVQLDSIRARAPTAHDAGRETFEAACASCHGIAGGGSVTGPPLVHQYYRPAHHADVAFLLAIQRGVRAHHWRYGDMPPIRGIDQQEAEQVVAYLRWLQREAGIE